MQLYSQEMELKCIVTLTSADIPERVRSTLLGKVSKEFFHYPPTVAAYNRISVVARKRFELVDFADLVSDPSLDEDFREILNDTDSIPCKGNRSIKRMIEKLDTYRKMRILYDESNKALDAIESESLDVDELLDSMSATVAHARKDLEMEESFVVMGKNQNSDDLIDEVLYGGGDELIKTGFDKYDTTNGGLPEEGVMIMAATTSGGKSTMLMNLMANMYSEEHKSVCRVSLEMGDKQEASRLYSRLSGVPFWKIKQKKTSPKEKQRIKKAKAAFDAIGEQHDCSFTTVSPTRNMTIDDCLRMVKPFRFNVIGIDYVSLLDGAGGDDQWKVLSEIIRVCKVFSRENKCLVIVLAQLDDESDKLRYSKGMKEHADVMWSWNYSKKEQRELKIIPVNTDKARDAELISFDLADRFDIMTVENLSDDSYNADEDDEDTGLTENETLDTDDEDSADSNDADENNEEKVDDYALS